MRRAGAAAILATSALVLGAPAGFAADGDELSAIRVDAPRPILPMLAPQSGSTPGGEWAVRSWRYDRVRDRLIVDMTFELAPHPLGLRPGPVVAFWTIAVREFDAEFNEQALWSPSDVETSVVEACGDPLAPCRTDLRLEADGAPLRRALVRGTRVGPIWPAVTLVRTFEAGALLQVLQPGSATSGTGGTVDRVRTMYGPFRPNALRPRGEFLDSYPAVGPFGAAHEPKDVDPDGAIEAALAGAPGTAGPDPWIPLSVSLRQLPETTCAGYGLGLVDSNGDIVLDRLLDEADAGGIRVDTHVARGGTWSLGSTGGDSANPVGRSFRATGDRMTLSGELSCADGDMTADVVIQATAAEEQIRPDVFLALLAVGIVAAVAVLGWGLRRAS